MKKYILIEVETDLINNDLRNLVEDALDNVPKTALTQRPKVNKATPTPAILEEVAQKQGRRKVVMVEMLSMVNNRETKKLVEEGDVCAPWYTLQATVMDANL